MPLVPIQWLREHVEMPEDLTPEELARDLVRVGLEEETIHEAEITGPVVVGKVLSREPKEQSNGKVINYCRIDVGAHNDAPGTGKEPSPLPSRGIICGAHNFDVGDYVVVSLPGAILPGGFEIAARKTYGHTSDGMMCSARELGMGDEHNGIIILAHPDEEEKIASLPALGEDVLPYLGVSGRTLEINITPDRGYCFSMRGVAREYHHSTGAKFKDPADISTPQANESGFPVVIEDVSPIHDQEGCTRFVTRIVRGIDPTAQSPDWMQKRLKAAGMRPISLAVDATNYVMLDLGQPLHAYDLDKVVGPLVVRRARKGESLTTLDDVQRELDTEDLLITDCEGGHGARVLGIAGVMGGASTEISETSTNVLIEAAHFDPVSIARSARRHKLPSEASKRFERGVDPEICAAAAQAVVDILVRFGGGVADPGVTDIKHTQAPQTYLFPLSEVNRLVGIDVPEEKIYAILEDIGCTLSAIEEIDGKRCVNVTPPSWRPDLTGSAHFVEEIARLVGYDEIPSRSPRAVAGHGLTLSQRARRDVMRALAEHGWVEVLSYPFISADVFDNQLMSESDERRRAIRLANPLQEDAPYLRTSVLDTLLSTASLNVARGASSLAVCETALVARPTEKMIESRISPDAVGVGKRPEDSDISALMNSLPSQPRHIGGIACGSVHPSFAELDERLWDWKDAIEAVRVITSTLGVSVAHKIKIDKAEYAPFHPGRCAKISADNILLGYAGELHPRVCSAWNLPARSIAFEIDLDAVIKARGKNVLSVDPVLTSPMAKEDMAFVVDKSTPAADLVERVRKAGGKRLESVYVFDVFEGEQVGEGKKSVALALRLRDDHTLSAEEISGIRKKIVKQAKKMGAELRS